MAKFRTEWSIPLAFWKKKEELPDQWILDVNLFTIFHASNPRHVLPSIAWRNSIWSSNTGLRFNIGSVAVVWLWFEFWVSLRHPLRALIAKEETDVMLEELLTKNELMLKG